MRIFDVELRFPSQADLLYVPFAAAGGTYLGSIIQRQTDGSLAPVAGMAAAAGVATFLALSGADLDAGWRGAALTLGGAVLAFALVTVTMLLLRA
tara:strand:- start:2252 stop:2536 length:285 start_codon:yes stop_codon:yes gene_type:complete